jgi:hypothetical protein
MEDNPTYNLNLYFGLYFNLLCLCRISSRSSDASLRRSCDVAAAGTRRPTSQAFRTGLKRAENGITLRKAKPYAQLKPVNLSGPS